MEEVYIKCERLEIEIKEEPPEYEDSGKTECRQEENVKNFNENNSMHTELHETDFQKAPIEDYPVESDSPVFPENPELYLKQTLSIPESSETQTISNNDQPPSSDALGKVYENGKRNRLNCAECGKSFKNRANLKNHIKYVHSEDQNLECPECMRSFKSQLYLRSHMSSVHAKTELVQCKHCQKVFMNKKKLNNHIYYTHRQPEEQVTCKVCSKTFKGPYNLKIHMRYVHPEGDPHPCLFCYKTFKVEMLLQRHMKWAHPEDGMVYRCQSCNKILPSMDCYKTHMKNVHLFERATCDICKRTFKTKKSLDRHMKNIHNGKNDAADVTPYTPSEHTCQYCERTFTNNTSLFWHIERCHAHVQKSPNNLCIICNKEFSDYAALHRHLTSVHSLETATCKICMKEFKSPINLQNHIRITHAPPEATQTCETCQKTFKCALHLRMHMLAVHAGGEFPCDICFKTFTSTKYLNKHKKSHIESRDYQCDICLKMYKNINSVNKHKKHVHNGIKCTICNIKQANIDDHFKKCHPDAALNLNRSEVSSTSSTDNQLKVDEVMCSKCDKNISCLEYKEHVENCGRPPIFEVTIKTEIEEEC